MPLNYSKWDNLELSDDSDIEEHPNVDKRSMIKWKQRDIHEKREARRLRIAKLRSELSLTILLRPRIQSVLNGLSERGIDHFRAVQRRLKENPSPEKPETGASNQPTYDMMLGQLLGDVWREAAWIVDGAKEEGGVVKRDGKKVDEKSGEPEWSTDAVPDGKKEGLTEALEGRLRWHLTELDRRDEEVKGEIDEEEKEQKKKITSEDIKEGWSQSTVAPAKPSPLEDKPKPKPERTTTETIEVLNPNAVASSPMQPEEDEPDFGPLTPSARAFAQIPIGDFSKSYAFIQRDSSVLTESTHDSLLAEAFDAERRGEKDLARRCVHQSLLVNYCRKLGRDGVGLFFQKMISANPKSIAMFKDDFASTYARIETRTKEMIAEESVDREQIQLVAEDPSMQISFNLPDGPPPAELRVEGEGSEEMDIEQVRAFLQMKWDTFEGFDEVMKRALRTEKLDEVNEVLGGMKVDEAEKVVELLQEGGMLSFSERGVRDMTQ